MPDLSNLLDTSQFLLPPCDSDVCFEDREPEVVEAGNGRCRIWDRRLRCLALEKSGSSAEKSGPGVTYSRRNHKRWGKGELVEAERRNKRAMSSKSLEDHVRDWVAKKMASGVPEKECQLPFLVNAPKMVECRLCNKPIYSGEEVLCSVRGCGDMYHRKCVQNSLGYSASRNFICPQHVCFICKQKGHWRCIRCMVAAHSKCAPWPDSVVYSLSQPRRAVCWRHPTDWRFEKKG